MPLSRKVSQNEKSGRVHSCSHEGHNPVQRYGYVWGTKMLLASNEPSDELGARELRILVYGDCVKENYKESHVSRRRTVA